MAEPKKTNSKTDPKQVMDVSKPGKAAPADNSKSVIVTSRPIMKDPMVVEDQPEVIEQAAQKITVKTGGKTIEPLSAPEVEQQVEPKLKTDKKPTVADLSQAATVEVEPETPKVDKPAPPAEDKPAPEQETPAEPTPSAPEPAKEPEPAPAAPPSEPTPSDPESDKGDKGNEASLEAEEAKAAEKAKHDQEVQKLIDSKQYFLPINAVEKRKSKRFVALGIVLSVILALAWADIALDAGLVQISGVKPVTHFFSN
jgi:hypothetical protein